MLKASKFIRGSSWTLSAVLRHPQQKGQPCLLAQLTSTTLITYLHSTAWFNDILWIAACMNRYTSAINLQHISAPLVWLHKVQQNRCGQCHGTHDTQGEGSWAEEGREVACWNRTVPLYHAYLITCCTSTVSIISKRIFTTLRVTSWHRAPGYSMWCWNYRYMKKRACTKG